MISVQLYADSKPLTIPVSTTYKSFRGARKWNEWVSLPIKFSQLPLSSQLAITIWDFAGGRNLVCYGGTTVRLFQLSDYTLKTGRQKLKVWLNKPADGHNISKTDSTINSGHEMDRLGKLIKKHKVGDLQQVNWLDHLTFRTIEQINKHEQHQHQPKDDRYNNHILNIDFIEFDFPIVFSDMEYTMTMSMTTSPEVSSLVPSLTLSKNDYSNRGGGGGSILTNWVGISSGKQSQTGNLILVNDPELLKENPIELKYKKLVRGHKTSPMDKLLKPTPEIRNKLDRIIDLPPGQEFSTDEKNLIWKFRHHLTDKKRALTKFLKATSWDDPDDTHEAIDLLPEWAKKGAEIDIDDALELLGPTFKHPEVRSYAVQRLTQASDHELELYLLQLVEALKFDSSLQRSSNRYTGSSNNKADLARFLIKRAARNPLLGNYFYWYVRVEAQEKPEIFQPVLDQFEHALENSEAANASENLDMLNRQKDLMKKLLAIAQRIRLSNYSHPKKIERLKAYLGNAEHGLLEFAPVALPLDPTVKVVGCIPEDCSVFKSSLFPLKVTLKTESGGAYPIMLKSGDDLRQDQLVIQIITLMDQLLQNENVDLKLTPYRILATGTRDGALQFIPNDTIASVLAKYSGILPYLRANNPDTNELKVKPDVMDTFVKSCAGYCVITYILGVGDRHLDNLLICPDGHFFHADFGYILGRDPKPFAPLMKLPIQLIEGMGGIDSENYTMFRRHCFTAYNMLRKSANLILNLFALMTESSIQDIMLEKDKAVQKVMEKFCLGMSEAEAELHFQNLINVSVNSSTGMFIDKLHNLAQYWRA